MPSRSANGLPRYPSLTIGALLDSHKHDIAAILNESLEAEAQALALYRELLDAVEGRSIALEEFARQMIQLEELHAAEVDKMLRKPGDVATYGRPALTRFSDSRWRPRY
jgi:bacterioferritin